MKKKEELRTAGFVGFGVLMCVAAGLTHFLTQPDNSKDFELVGQPFFVDFTSASQAKSLEVAALDPDSAALQKFSVAEKDGLWRIPSHYNYPAEATERLATTATSVMGIERESLVGRLESDHERFGVVDPLDDAARDPDSTGKRITLKNEDGEPILDFIVGKEAGEVDIPDAQRAMQDGPLEKYFYVRRPDEMQTYKVKLNVDISTRFADWIEPDLLKLANHDIRRIAIDNYELQEKGGLGQRQVMKIQDDQLTLNRDGAMGNWTLDGLNPETEELENSRIDEIIDALDEMKIVGVRPKFKYMGQQLVTADLTINDDPEFQKNPREFNAAINRLLTELNSRGFTIYENPDPILISTLGSVTVGTQEGVSYLLNFGKSVEGDEKAIEIGGNEESGDSKDDPGDSSEPVPDEPESESDPDNLSSAGGNSEATNRYLMIRVVFDESLLGDRPQKPIKPLKPAEPDGYAPPPAKNETKDPSAAESADAAPADAAPADVEIPALEDKSADAAPSPEEDDERKPEFVDYDEAMLVFEQQLTEYNLNLTRYENDLKAFELKVEAGTERVKPLNERFADWYYVISADNLNSLQTTRKDAVKSKENLENVELPLGAPENNLPKRPDISFEMPVGERELPPTQEGADDASANKESDGDPGSDKGDASERPPTAVPSSDEKQDGDGEGTLN